MSASKRGAPAAAVAAAFLGPGTVTTCSLAGIHYGTSLLWVLLVSLAVLIIAQSMCVRLGVFARQSLSQGLAGSDVPWFSRILLVALAVAAIGVGCAAYQAGNLRGAAQGLVLLLPVSEQQSFLLVAALAVVLLAMTRREWLLRVLVIMVLAMTVFFLGAAVLSRPSWSSIQDGLLRWRLPSVLRGQDGWLYVAGLVGTTIVPYNLFLHSALARDRSEGMQGYRRERRELWLFLPLGIVVSMIVMVVAAAAFHGQPGAPSELSQMARQLEQPLGSAGRYVFGAGLLAAGLSSALTAPMAAGMAIADLHRTSPVWLRQLVQWLVMATGITTYLLHYSSTKIIQFAQVTNAILLPVTLTFLVTMVTRSKRLKQHRLGPFGATLGWIVVLLSIGLAARTVWKLGGQG